MKFIKSITGSSLLISVVAISACTSHIPPEIKQAPEDAPGVAQVRKQTDNYLSQTVRWGGAIIETENREKASWLTIIALPLSEEGKPQSSDQSPGRFIAIVDDFLEPQLYSQNRHITITGKILKTETHNVGEYPYEYPVVQVEHYYLWPVEPEPSYADYPPYWWYDPWYDPWYGPYYPWHTPYYYPHHHH